MNNIKRIAKDRYLLYKYYAVQISYSCYTDIIQLLYMQLLNDIRQTLHTYYTDITQILHSYHTDIHRYYTDITRYYTDDLQI